LSLIGRFYRSDQDFYVPVRLSFSPPSPTPLCAARGPPIAHDSLYLSKFCSRVFFLFDFSFPQHWGLFSCTTLSAFFPLSASSQRAAVVGTYFLLLLVLATKAFLRSRYCFFFLMPLAPGLLLEHFARFPSVVHLHPFCFSHSCTDVSPVPE